MSLIKARFDDHERAMFFVQRNRSYGFYDIVAALNVSLKKESELKKNISQMILCVRSFVYIRVWFYSLEDRKLA